MLAIVMILSLAAAICAFLIEYEEGLHRFPRRRARARALQSAVVTGLVFAGLGTVVSTVFLHVL